MTKCTTCRSPLVRQADALYVAGMSAAGVASRLGLLKQSMQRHVREGHVSRTAQDDARATVPTQDGQEQPNTRKPTGRATHDDMRAELQQQLDDLNAMDTSSMTPTTLISLSDAKRRVAESLAKASPVEPGVVRVTEVEGLGELFATMHETLKNHPGAREALAAAWRASREAGAQPNEETR